MEKMDHKEIAENWIKYHHLPKREKNKSPLFSAWEELDELVHKNPVEAWEVIILMYRLDSSDLILANIAAGPVEDLLCLHGSTFIERIETLAGKDKIFKKLLGAVWGQNRMSKEIWNRLKAVAGNTF